MKLFLIFASITKCNEISFGSEIFPIFLNTWIFDAVLYTVCIYMFAVFVQLLIMANNFLKKTFWTTSYLNKNLTTKRTKSGFYGYSKMKRRFLNWNLFGKRLNWSVLECPLLKIYSRNFGIHQNGLNQNDVKGNI